MHVGQVIFPGIGQVFLRRLAAHDINADVLIQGVDCLQKNIKALPGDELSHGEQHLLFRNAQGLPQSLLALQADRGGENITLRQRGEMVAPQGVGLCAVVQVVFVQLLAGGEIQRRAPDALGLDALFQPVSAFGESAVPLQAVGNPAQLTPGNGQKLRR